MAGDILGNPADWCPNCGENDTDNLHIFPEDNEEQIFIKEQVLVELGESADSRKDVVQCFICGTKYLLSDGPVSKEDAKVINGWGSFTILLQ